MSAGCDLIRCRKGCFSFGSKLPFLNLRLHGGNDIVRAGDPPMFFQREMYHYESQNGGGQSEYLGTVRWFKHLHVVNATSVLYSNTNVSPSKKYPRKNVFINIKRRNQDSVRYKKKLINRFRHSPCRRKKAACPPCKCWHRIPFSTRSPPIPPSLRGNCHRNRETTPELPPPPMRPPRFSLGARPRQNHHHLRRHPLRCRRKTGNGKRRHPLPWQQQQLPPARRRRPFRRAGHKTGRKRCG